MTTMTRHPTTETSAAQVEAPPRELPLLQDPALAQVLIEKIREAARPVVEKGPQSTPDEHYEAHLLAMHVVAHPDSVIIAHEKLMTWVVETLEGSGCIDTPDTEVLNLLKELLDWRIGGWTFENGEYVKGPREPEPESATRRSSSASRPERRSSDGRG